MKYIFILLTSILTFTLGCTPCNRSQCNVSSTDTVASSSLLKQYAAKKFDSYRVTYNAKKDFAYCVENTKGVAGISRINYFVYALSSNEEIWKDLIPNGSINWKSEYILEIIEIPGIIKKDDESMVNRSGYLFNVITRKKLNRN
ncbi:MAG: hypothetical protein KJ799_09920 [Bacteroidetes bacterium]|nr:hypothetical protein [Bacteroidota bacterium]